MTRARPNYIYAIVSVSLVLFIVGFFALTALHARRLVALYKEKIDIWLELKPDLPETEIARIVGTVRRQPFVKAETVTFITRQQAAVAMKEELGEASLLEEMPDLLRDIVRFNVQAAYANSDSLRSWREQMKQDTAIFDLYYEATNLGNVGKNIENMGWITLGLGFLLIFAAIALIHNTIRLELYSNRFVIKNQELVGASWGFISRPYIRRGLINGLWSALLAIAGLIAAMVTAQRVIPELGDFEDLNLTLAVFLGLIALGVLISGLSSYIVVHKFLRMKLDDLY